MSALPSETPTLHDEARQSAVDVSRAEEQFSELIRQISNESHRAHDIPVREHQSIDKKLSNSFDQEKGELPLEEEPFDLREYLSSSNDKNTQAGIKHKHVGVSWEDLQVDVFGGAGNKVSGQLFVFVPQISPPAFCLSRSTSGHLGVSEITLVLRLPHSLT